jgi:hypothetical protein
MTKNYLLPGDKPNTELKTFNTSVYIYLEPESRKIETIISYGPFVTSEYDPEADAWVPVDNGDGDRLFMYRNEYASYLIDWNNDEAFDENDKSIVYQKYADGTLTEEDLKKYCIFNGEAPEDDYPTEEDFKAV